MWDEGCWGVGCGTLGCWGGDLLRGLSGESASLALEVLPAVLLSCVSISWGMALTFAVIVSGEKGKGSRWSDGCERFILGGACQGRDVGVERGRREHLWGVPSGSAVWTRFSVSPRDPAGWRPCPCQQVRNLRSVREGPPVAAGRSWSPRPEASSHHRPSADKPARLAGATHTGRAPWPLSTVGASAVLCGPTSRGFEHDHRTSGNSSPSCRPPAVTPGIPPHPPEATGLRCGSLGGAHTSPSTGWTGSGSDSTARVLGT